MEKVDQTNMIVKPPKTSKGQVIGIVVVAVVALLLLGGLIAIFVINFNKTTAPSVNWYDTDGVFYFKARANDNFYGYRFKFVDTDSKEELTFDSDDALISIDDCPGLEVGHKYEISVCYKGEVDGGNSEYGSKTTWPYYDYLQTPVLALGDNEITWNAVPNANYYIVTYQSLFQTPVRVETTSFSFENLPLGPNKLKVVAYSNQSFHHPSRIAAQIDVTVKKNLLPFDSATIDSSQRLVIRGKEALDAIQIKVDEKEYVFFSSDFAMLGNVGAGYTFTIDLSNNKLPDVDISTAGYIGVKPSSASIFFHEYIVFEGDYLQVTRTA